MKAALLIACIILLSVVWAAGQTTSPKCPEVSVVGPQGITTKGDIMALRAQITGLESGPAVTYDWKVSGGQILERQASDQIRIQTTDEDSGRFISATVSVKGLPENCPNGASGKWGVTPWLYDPPFIDQFGRIRWREEQARLDNFHIQIRGNPGSTGLIYLQIRSADSIDAAKKHARKIAKYFRSLDKQFDVARVKFALVRGMDHPSTSFYLVPKGEMLPLCTDKCILLNGKDL